MKPGVTAALCSGSTSAASRSLRACLHDLNAVLAVGAVHEDLAVEAAGTEQRGIEDLRTVRRGEQHDALARIEPVQLGKELV